MITSSLSRVSSISFSSFLMHLKAPPISRKAKDAAKVGLAFAIAYVIALKTGWLSPFWAAFTIGQISFYPGGQSLHNGFMRLFALFPAIVVATLIYAVAAQDRWLFVALGVLWLMFVTYMMLKDQAHWYFWNVAGFAAFIFLSTSYTDSTDLFNQMTGRLLDCSLGITVYTLVMVFLWPDSNIQTINKNTINLLTAQSKIFTQMTSQPESEEDQNSLRQTLQQELLLQSSLKVAFAAKGSETYQVQETIVFWREMYGLSIQLSETFSRLNNSFHGVKNIDIYKLIPELDRYRGVIEQRFALAEDILEKGNREFKIEPIVLSVDETYLAGLSPFDQLAFASSKKEFEAVEALSGKIVRCANNIMDESVPIKKVPKKVSSIYERLIPDLDILQRVIFIGSFTFTMFLIWFYYDPPSHEMWIYLPPTIALSIAFMPLVKTNAWILPGFFILTFYELLYLTVFPKLSGVTELFIALFIIMFSVKYFLKGSIQFIAFLGVGTKIMLHNEQTYDFIPGNSMTILHLSSYALVFSFAYMMGTPRPQRAVLWRIRRYYKSALFLTSVTASKQQMDQASMWMKYKIAFHRYELQKLPLKIKPWAGVINQKYFFKNTPNEIDDMIIGLIGLSESLDEWFTSNTLPQTPLMFDETKKELEAWRSGIEKIFQRYTENLDSVLPDGMEEGLNRHIRNLEEIVNRHIDEIEQLKESVSKEEKENMFRLMASYQGLSHALIAYVSVAEKIDWKHWEEEVFA